MQNLAEFLAEDDFNVILFSNQSEESIKLDTQLSKKGYQVAGIFTGAEEPTAIRFSETVVGYANIRREYLNR